MTREIKFKAWDEQNKIMHFDFQFIKSGEAGNDWIIFKSDKQKLEKGDVFNNPYFSQQLKIMQWTGLLDKNGKEIYEGDIVSVSLSLGYSNNRVVVWNKIGGSWCFSEDGIQEGIDLDFTDIGDDIEIIGNIHENKELLK